MRESDGGTAVVRQLRRDAREAEQLDLRGFSPAEPGGNGDASRSEEAGGNLTSAMARCLIWAEREASRRVREAPDEQQEDGDDLFLAGLSDDGLLDEARDALIAGLAADRIGELARRRRDVAEHRAWSAAMERHPQLEETTDLRLDLDRMALVMQEGGDVDLLLDLARKVLEATGWTRVGLAQGIGLDEIPEELKNWVNDLVGATTDGVQKAMLGVIVTGSEGARAAIAAGRLATPLAFLALNLASADVPTTALDAPANASEQPEPPRHPDPDTPTREQALAQYRALVEGMLHDLSVAHSLGMDMRVRSRSPELRDLARAISGTRTADPRGFFAPVLRGLIETWLADAAEAAAFAVDPPEGAPAFLVRVAQVLGETVPSEEMGEVGEA